MGSSTHFWRLLARWSMWGRWRRVECWILINDAGQIAGSSQTAFGYTRAFVSDPNGGTRDLGTIGGRESRGMAINTSGIVAGGLRKFPDTFMRHCGTRQERLHI